MNGFTSLFVVVFSMLLVTRSIPSANGFTVNHNINNPAQSSIVLPLGRCSAPAGCFSRTCKTFDASSPRVAETKLQLVQDLDVVALVAGQENYGLALVALGEGIYSFLQAPTLSNIKVVIPPAVAAVLLVAVSGPMITSGDASAAGTGLWIATAVSMALGLSYVLRLLSPPSESFVPKEVAALGLVVAAAGFFSFSQNLLVDGFVTLPSLTLPGLPMPPSDNYPGWDI